MKNKENPQQYWAIILGGSSGMGLASAAQLAKSGINLCLVFRERRSQLELLERELDKIRSETGVQIITFNKDAINPDVMNAMITEIKVKLNDEPCVRMLLHSIARGNLKALGADEKQNLTSLDFELTIDAMALSWYRWTKALIGAELFAKDARLLAFTSEGSHRAWKGYAAVSAAKASLEALMRGMALEFAPLGLRCNILQPGVTDTPSLRMIPGNDKMIAAAESRNPFHRLTTPQDVARVVELMCRDEAAWINGAIIPVDGGESIGT